MLFTLTDVFGFRELSDVTRDGQLNLFEFIVACKLIQMKLRGFNIPPALPPPLSDLVTGKSGERVTFLVRILFIFARECIDVRLL